MRIEVKSARGIELIDLDTRLLSNRYLYLTGEITSSVADEFCKELMYLLELDQTSPVFCFINSPGGSVRAGWKIIDYITGCHPEQIFLICDGIAYSMAAVIMCAGKKGHRYCTRNSSLMIHEPWLEEVGGSSTAVKAVADKMIRSKEDICNIISANTGRSMGEIEKDIMYDHYFNSTEAVQYGLCDEVTTIGEMMKKKLEKQ